VTQQYKKFVIQKLNPRFSNIRILVIMATEINNILETRFWAKIQTLLHPNGFSDF
jgi:hypothetical protein